MRGDRPRDSAVGRLRAVARLPSLDIGAHPKLREEVGPVIGFPRILVVDPHPGAFLIGVLGGSRTKPRRNGSESQPDGVFPGVRGPNAIARTPSGVARAPSRAGVLFGAAVGT